MINFRYHVVSLVAVFMALAVGVLLGAGPLKEPIESSVAEQVSSLREDKQLLRDELAAASTRGVYADTAFRALQPQALSELLTGQPVAIVTIGGDVQARRVEDVKASLAAAGAVLAAEVNLPDDWVGSSEKVRAGAATAVADLLGERGGESLGDRAMIAAGLAVALRGPDGAAGPDSSGQTGQDSEGQNGKDGKGGEGGASGGEPDPALVELPGKLFEALRAAGLAAGSISAPAAGVIVLSGPYIDDPAKIKPTNVTDGRREHYTGVVSALAEAGLRTVVCGPDQADSDLVHRLRNDSVSATSVSTVAAPLPAAESITALWALAASFHSINGAYGIDGDDLEFPPYQPAPAAGQPGAEGNGGAGSGASPSVEGA
ncbi:MAG: copper transporter [Bifidobacteriaceae bacterium]|jgi:hypothetical protein|nr:copper transporter [Bifidobacteriaceae bacterium]